MSTVTTRRPPAFGNLQREGDEGVYTQCWFPIATSAEVPPGRVVGKDFLDGRVVVFRGEDGEASVLSAYCTHTGADLAVGDVVGNCVRCAFHHWQFNGDGSCAKTGSDDPVPSDSDVFAFPTQEKYGLIWAFNGTEPLYEVARHTVRRARHRGQHRVARV
jgi:phenylpropionate dioxygenase-like ring-hydroxylating dioxygenase large terminal subunit